ncbi:hypothetical protein AUEXF2481DRAFT_600866 [Aureobasidium subglaciale EXF-2481]|uniref:Uncharacterized protein n=1 Tax=Aureobasidium subglaciale (strain EXF-2481) TaxID=1043005 RepID=A0A074YTJ0_AURSE|nr:uncharacterized protein AUEXF2481DRAFT_600866 [Aureobasidium subglaciale EXF-2481]KEQ97457.1 hypothetical protein AUEXF2481DRAFT_600866 [Aureobasidium subglaciale EXF-2481]
MVHDDIWRKRSVWLQEKEKVEKSQGRASHYAPTSKVPPSTFSKQNTRTTGNPQWSPFSTHAKAKSLVSHTPTPSNIPRNTPATPHQHQKPPQPHPQTQNHTHYPVPQICAPTQRICAAGHSTNSIPPSLVSPQHLLVAYLIPPTLQFRMSYLLCTLQILRCIIAVSGLRGLGLVVTERMARRWGMWVLHLVIHRGIEG